MLVRFTFPYRADVRAAGRRRTEDVWLRGEVTAEVGEVAVEDAPVAAWWRPPDHVERPCELALRVHEGAVLQPVCREGGGDPGAFVRRGDVVPVAARELSGGCDGTDLANAWPHLFGREDARELTELAPGMRVVGSTEAQATSDLLAAVGRLRLVGGVLHREVPLPVLVANPILGVSAGYADDTFEDATTLYGLDEHGTAIAACAGALRQDHLPAPEVLLPEALAFDALPPMVADTARAVVNLRLRQPWASHDRAPAPALDEMTRGQLAAWADVRDAQAAGAPTAAVLDAISAFGSSVSGEDGHDALRRCAERVARCVGRAARERDPGPDLSDLAL